MREWLEYAAAWTGLKILGALPRSVARFVGATVVALAYALRPPLRRAADFNLKFAFPGWTDAQRKKVVRGMVRQVGWMAAEFARFPKYVRGHIERVVVIDGAENFEAARQRGSGVLFLTGHMSAWELAPFAHALYGHPLHFLVRPIKNRRVDELINRYRCLSGNRPIEKNKSARMILKVLGDGGTVGILSDHNTSREEGVFVDFFGVPACMTSGIARIALRTGAAGGAGISVLGPGAENLPAAIRARGGTGADRERRGGRAREHAALRAGDRGLCPRAPGSVAVGAQEVEDAPGWREAALSVLRSGSFGNCERV